MSLPEISIRRPVFAWMLMLGLVLFGIISLDRLGISRLPDVDFPVLNIDARWQGAAPDIMESEIADKLEQAVIAVQGLKDITSRIRQGQVSITLEFDLSRDVDAALQEVQSAISRVRLPLDVDLPTISKTNPDDQPIIWVGISGNRSLRDLISFVDLHVKDQFQIIPGVGEINLGGFTERNLRIWVDNKKLDALELTILDVRNAIAEQHIETAAGVIETDSREMNLRVMGEGISPTEVENILISKRGGRPIFNAEIRIKDIGRVEDSLNDIRRLSRIMGVPAIGLGIRKQRGANAVKVGDLVKAKIEEVAKTLPPDMKIGVNFDDTRFTKESIEETKFTLLLSAIATALVCWLFLGSFSPTFNILLSIPTSVLGTFIFIYFFGFTLNLFTLLGLTLAIGIIVDDAIMVLENIYRHIQMGKSAFRGALDGATEISFAAVAASVAVIAIFVPIAFMQGIIGKFLLQFAVTISTAVALSLLEAVTLTPMRASQLLSVNEGWFGRLVGAVFARLAENYRRILSIALRFRWITIFASLCLFGGSLFIAKLLPKELLPAEDQGIFLMRLQGPVDSSLERTSELVRSVEEFFSKRKDVLRYFTAIGGFGGGEVNTATMFITLVPPSERDLSQKELMDLCRKELGKIPDLKVFVQDLSLRGFTAQRGFPIEFNIRGGDWSILAAKSEQMIKKLESSGLLRDIDTDYRVGMPEVRVWPLREEAARRGVSIKDIGDTVAAAIGGVREGKYTSDGRRYDVRIRLESDERLDPSDIERLFVRNSHGELVKLGDVTRVETAPTVQTITRRSRERSITIFANVGEGRSQAEALEYIEKTGKDILPEGYLLYLGGGSKAFQESFQGLLFVLGLGIIVAYMVLGSQFNSFLDPITVLLSLPFSISGAFFALYLWGQSINLYSMIGIILLMGIVKKNAILLVEFTNKKREEGLSMRDAILTASPIRLRPILMTSFATIAAALPPAVQFGPGAESSIPMAVTVIGGVLISTFFTLFVVPCAHSLISRHGVQKKDEA